MFPHCRGFDIRVWSEHGKHRSKRILEPTYMGAVAWKKKVYSLDFHLDISFLHGTLHRKKRFTSFPSPAGMSLTKLPLGRNNSVMTSLFPPRESLVVTSWLGTGNSRTFFYGVLDPKFYYRKLNITNGWKVNASVFRIKFFQFYVSWAGILWQVWPHDQPLSCTRIHDCSL